MCMILITGIINLLSLGEERGTETTKRQNPNEPLAELVQLAVNCPSGITVQRDEWFM